MANWKKMAEAFGRATFGKNDNNSIVKAARDSYKRDLNNYRDKEAGDRAESFFKGQEEERMANNRVDKDFNSLKSLKNENTRELMKDVDADYQSDQRLIEQREKEWDDAFKSAKEHVKRGYGDSYPEDMASEGADTFEKQLWDVIDGLKAQGRSVEDILGALKSMGAK